MTTSSIWLSFDLGVRGDYESFYTWLDQHGAKECGDSVAHLKYEHTGPLLSTLKNDLESSIEITKKTRVYVIRRDPDTGTVKGKFLIGGRKASPWEGYAGNITEVDDDSN